MKILIEPFSSDWNIEFEQLSKVFQKQLGGLLAGVEHVGSTSVYGLASKPILDIDLIIDNVSILPSITEILQKLGYDSKGIVGIPDRYVFAAQSEFVPFTDPPRLWMPQNLYVCISGSTALKNHINFRNYLRNDVKAAADYAALKYRLAEGSESIEHYVSDKTEFINAILKKCGFSQSELGDIEKVNIIKIEKIRYKR